MKQINNPFSLEGKRYLITGAASGIGRSTSIILSEAGADLILVDINHEGLVETQKKCNPSDKLLVLDLANSSIIKKELLAVVMEFGKLDGFVHLAGKSYIAPLKIVNEEKCKDIFSLNTYAAIELAKTFINKKVYNGVNGSIVLISSVYGVVGSAANVGYAMSKSALHGITKSLAIELASKKIRVNCIAPGFVKTNMLDSASGMFDEKYEEKLNNLHPLGLGTPEDIAYSIVYLLSDASKWVTGSIFNIDGGFTAL